MSINRDRNGEIYEIEMNPLPPPSSEKNVNRLWYIVKEQNEVINDLLNRVYELETLRTEEILSHVPEPSVEYPYRKQQ